MELSAITKGDHDDVELNVEMSREVNSDEIVARSCTESVIEETLAANLPSNSVASLEEKPTTMTGTNRRSSHVGLAVTQNTAEKSFESFKGTVAPEIKINEKKDSVNVGQSNKTASGRKLRSTPTKNTKHFTNAILSLDLSDVSDDILANDSIPPVRICKGLSRRSVCMQRFTRPAGTIEQYLDLFQHTPNGKHIRHNT